jgi:hypothetical protein
VAVLCGEGDGSVGDEASVMGHGIMMPRDTWLVGRFLHLSACLLGAAIRLSACFSFGCGNLNF